MEGLNVKESSHFEVFLFLPQALDDVHLEVGVVEKPQLHLSKQHDEQEAHREPTSAKLGKSNTLKEYSGKNSFLPVGVPMCDSLFTAFGSRNVVDFPTLLLD